MMTINDKEFLARIIVSLRRVSDYRGQFERDLGDYQLQHLRSAQSALNQLVDELEKARVEQD